ncbi:integrase [Bradyrhizobium sp. CIR48]|nr:integrase [Bradyrhizobium sp. CIR18]MBB4429298.1 integrase [Bradyrhizobium sp. CIR48]
MNGIDYHWGHYCRRAVRLSRRNDVRLGSKAGVEVSTVAFRSAVGSGPCGAKRASQSRGPRADVALAYLLRVLTAGRPVKFELTESTRQVIDDYLRVAGRRSGEYLFTGRRLSGHMTTRQYARLLSRWLADIGLDPHLFGTHSLRRTKATLIYRRTGNLRAVQLLPGILRSRAPFDISASRSTMPSR